MKSLKNDVKAWLLLCSGLGTILFFNGVHVLHCRLSKSWFIQHGRGRKPI